ncbi:MAG: sulfatase [Planctomycetota bacterium]
MPSSKPNLLLIGIDSLRRDHMSLHGYARLTTPHIDRFAEGGAVFEHCFSPHIPTTSGYGGMLTGRDCFGTNTVALRHKGPMAEDAPTLAELLGDAGYQTTCVGFKGNPASRGFGKYVGFDGWSIGDDGRAHKAEALNDAALPELRRLAATGEPFFLFVRHMDPHTPYLPPAPFERMFYAGDECDPTNDSMQPVYDFAPFADYFKSWLPEGVTDAEYVIAQYDGGVAYMDACIANIFAELTALGLDDDTLVVLTSDHGETLYDHDCYFDHHGIYDPTLVVPLVFRLPGVVPAGVGLEGNCLLQDITPTVLDLLGVKTKAPFDGQSLVPQMKGKPRKPATEFYLTECTWMRKHGWRTPEWKLIHALEPDFHFKPEIELYNLVDDPEEYNNLAKQEPAVVELLEARMQAWIAKREKQTGRTNPMFTNTEWTEGAPFASSEAAYNGLHIGSIDKARQLQDKDDE